MSKSLSVSRRGGSLTRPSVILDTHIYQIFSTDQVARTPAQHIRAACDTAPKLRGTDKWTVVGEWTGAQTDCAKWLNGFQRGARYDGTFDDNDFYVGSCAGKRTGTVAGLSSDDKRNIRSFIEAQLDAYEAHTGWIFWTWKTESAPEWDMQDLLANGLFPQPISNRQCKFSLSSSLNPNADTDDFLVGNQCATGREVEEAAGPGLKFQPEL